MKQKFNMPDGEIVERDMPAWKTPYNHDTNFESDRTGLYCADPSLTKQEFKEETDINVILKRFMRTGEPPPMALPEHFADLTGRESYFDMASRIADANRLFYQLPAEIRSEFLNDPARWADAVHTAVQRGDGDTLVDLGVDLDIRPPKEAAKGTEGNPITPADPPNEPPKAASKAPQEGGHERDAK